MHNAEPDGDVPRLWPVWYWFFKFVVVAPIARWYVRPRWSGRENLPRTGAFLLAGNHMTMIDPVVISLGVPRRVIFIAKQKYYSGTSLRRRALAWFLRAVGQVPIDPASAAAASPGLDAAGRIIQDGGVVALFPEGTRSPDGRLYRGRRGRVAITYDAPFDLSRWADRPDDPAAWREATDALMARIAELSGQEYCNRYATDEERQQRDQRTGTEP